MLVSLQYCLWPVPEPSALNVSGLTFASVSAFQTIGMMSTQKNVGWVEGVEVEAMVLELALVEAVLLWSCRKPSLCW
jgi:hypothetical protein